MNRRTFIRIVGWWCYIFGNSRACGLQSRNAPGGNSRWAGSEEQKRMRTVWILSYATLVNPCIAQPGDLMVQLSIVSQIMLHCDLYETAAEKLTE